jgi:hypothetical protein
MVELSGMCLYHYIAGPQNEVALKILRSTHVHFKAKEHL